MFTVDIYDEMEQVLDLVSDVTTAADLLHTQLGDFDAIVREMTTEAVMTQEKIDTLTKFTKSRMQLAWDRYLTAESDMDADADSSGWAYETWTWAMLYRAVEAVFPTDEGLDLPLFKEVVGRLDWVPSTLWSEDSPLSATDNEEGTAEETTSSLPSAEDDSQLRELADEFFNKWDHAMYVANLNGFEDETPHERALVETWEDAHDMTIRRLSPHQYATQNRYLLQTWFESGERRDYQGSSWFLTRHAAVYALRQAVIGMTFTQLWTVETEWEDFAKHYVEHGTARVHLLNMEGARGFTVQLTKTS